LQLFARHFFDIKGSFRLCGIADRILRSGPNGTKWCFLFEAAMRFLYDEAAECLVEGISANLKLQDKIRLRAALISNISYGGAVAVKRCKLNVAKHQEFPHQVKTRKMMCAG